MRVGLQLVSVMGNSRAVEGFLDATVSGSDNLGRNSANEAHRMSLYGWRPPRVHRLSLGRDFSSRPARPKPPDLRPAICSGRLRAPCWILVLTGPAQNTETPTLVPSNSCSGASDSDRTAYLLI